MPTEFISAIASSGDYTTPSTWESSVQCDLTSANTVVLGHSGITGALAAADTVTGNTSTATGTIIAITATQILLTVTSGTFQTGEQIYKTLNTDYVTSNTVPDSAIAVAELANEDFTNGSAEILVVAGWTSSATNYPVIRAAAGAECLGLDQGARLYDGTNSGSSSTLVKLEVDYTRFERIACHSIRTSPVVISNAAANGVLVDGCYFYTAATGNSITGFSGFGKFDTYRNCVLEGGLAAFFADKEITIENCTVVESGGGVYVNTSDSGVAANIIIKNLVYYSGGTTSTYGAVHKQSTQHAGTADYIAALTGEFGSNTQTNQVTITVSDFDNTTSYRPAEGGLLDSAGADLSGTFTTDAAGRHRRFWSIGAFDWWALYARVMASPVEADEYGSLGAAESGEQKDLTAYDAVQLIECEAFVMDTASVTITSWTTSATAYLIVRAAAGHEHYGVFDAGPRIVHADNEPCLLISQDYTQVIGLEATNNDTTTNAAAKGFRINSGLATAWLLENCIARSYNEPFWLVHQGASVLRNCIGVVLDGTDNAFDMGADTGSTGTIHNCTAIVGGGSGLGSGFTNDNAARTFLDVRNNVSYGFSTGFAVDVQDADTFANNASDDASGNITGITSAAFVDYASGKYRPAEGGVLESAGADLSGTFTTDVAGRLRRFWSIGAFDWHSLHAMLSTTDTGPYVYSTVSSLESGEQKNLTNYGCDQVLECDAGTYNSSTHVKWAGWTTNASSKIIMRPVAGAEHNGVPYTGVRIRCNENWEVGFIINQTYFRIYDICIEHYGSNSGWCFGTDQSTTHSGAGSKAIRCIITSNANDAVTVGWTQASISDNNFSFIDCVMIQSNNGAGIDALSQWRGFNFFNCTIYGQFQLDARYAQVENCVVYRPSGTAWSLPNGLRTSVVNYCGSHDTSTPGTNAVNNIDSSQYASIGGFNLRPVENSTLIGAGFDSGQLTTDVAGRPKRFYSLGAYDYWALYALVTTGTPAADDEYALLSTAEASEQKDLTAYESVQLFEVDGNINEGDAVVDFAGWTANANCYVHIRAKAGTEPNGTTSGTSHAEIKTTTNYDRTLSVDATCPYLRASDMRFVTTGGIGASALYIDASAKQCVFERCVFVSSGTSTAAVYIGAPGDDAGAIFRNCLVETSGACDAGFYASVFTTQVITLQNVTVVGNSTYGIHLNSGGSALLENCVSYGATTTEIYDQATSIDLTNSRNNAAGDTTGTAVSASGGVNNITTTDFVDYAGGVYRPAEGGALDGAGADLSGTFTTDIAQRRKRFNSIGAFDYWALYARVMASPVEADEYATLQAAEAAEQKDLPAWGAVQIIECEAFTVTGTKVSIAGWSTTTADYYVHVRAAPGHEHNGVYGQGHIQQWTGGGYNSNMTVQDPHTIVEGITLKNLTTGGGTTTALGLNTAPVYVRNCFAVATTDAAFRVAGGTTNELRNCVALDSSTGFGTANTQSYLVENCAAIDCTAGFAAGSGGYTAKNCVAYGNTTDFDTANYLVASDYNASGDSTAATISATNSVTGVASTDFSDYAGDNFRPSEGSALLSVGTDLSGNFTDDLAGRPRRFWSIGAFDYWALYTLLTPSPIESDEYSNLATAEASEQKDLTAYAACQIIEAQAFEDAPGGTVAIGGWTTSATAYIIFRAQSGHAHDGRDAASGYRIKTTGSYQHLNVNQQYTRVENIAFISTNSQPGTVSVAGDYITLDGVFYHRQNASGTVAGNLTNATLVHGMELYNCIAIDDSTVDFATAKGVIYFNSARTNPLAYNCTAIRKNTQAAIGNASTNSTYAVELKNCVARNASTNEAYQTTNWKAGSTNNATSNSVAGNCPATNAIVGITDDDFADVANNLFMAKGDGALFEAGVNLYATFTQDVRGYSRLNSAFDIGAFHSGPFLIQHGGATDSKSITFGQTPSSGNLLVVHASPAQDGTMAVPAGWTELRVVNNGGAGRHNNILVGAKISEGNEGLITFTYPSGGRGSMAYAEFANVGTLGDLQEAVTTGGTGQAETTRSLVAAQDRMLGYASYSAEGSLDGNDARGHYAISQGFIQLQERQAQNNPVNWAVCASAVAPNYTYNTETETAGMTDDQLSQGYGRKTVDLILIPIARSLCLEE